jgi:hypothetical protein
MAGAWGASWGTAWGSAWGAVGGIASSPFLPAPLRVSRPSIQMTQNDTAPPMRQRLLGSDGRTPQPLPAGSVVRFTLRKPDGVVSINRRVCTIVDGANGDVEAGWQTGDLPVAGQYAGELEVTTPDGLIETFPSGRKIRVIVTAELG